MIQEITGETFESSIQSGVSVVDFYTPTCGPCRMLAPTLESITSAPVYKVDAANFSANGSVCVKHKIIGVPTLIYFKDGVEVFRSVGVVSKDAIESKIQEIQ